MTRRDRPTSGGGAEAADRLLIMGRIGAPFGVRGWVRVHVYTACPDNLMDYSPWWVGREGRWDSCGVAEARPHGKGLIARLEGIGDREAARGLLGADVAVERSRLDDPEQGRYYWADLVGAAVVNREGVDLGTVAGLMETGAHDVLVVAGERERLIPFVPARYVLDVDLARRRIVVDWQPDY